MAQYFTDFAGNTVGTGYPTGWTARWDATTLWDIVAGPYVQWTTDFGSSRQDGLSWDTPGSISGDCQIAVLCRTNFASGSQCGAIIHASTAATSGYAVCLSGLGDELAVTRLDAGAETLLTGGSFTWAVNTDYWIRVERTGTTIRARAWADGAGEPGTWAFSNTDATYSSGVIGLFARNLNGDKIFKRVGVGTAGDAAPLSAPSGSSIPVLSAGMRQRMNN
jgi:hypothetical protein